MGEWKKLTANERQKIFYDHKNWNDGRKKSGNSGKETPYNKTETKWQIKQIQVRLDDNKKRFVSLPKSATKSYNNYTKTSN